MFVLAFFFIISAHNLHTSYATVTKNAVENNDIPEPCRNLTYCTIKPKNYPEEKFKNMFKDYFEPLYHIKPKSDEPWRLVVQVPEKNYEQRVRVERCTNPGAQCFQELKPREEYVTYCKQKTNTWEVVVAKGDNETETIKVELPVCCSCHYKPVDFMTVLGISKK